MDVNKQGLVLKIAQAKSFSEWWSAWRLVYEHLPADPQKILDLAHAVAADYPGEDLGEHLYEIALHTIQCYLKQFGTFSALFEKNLRERFRRDVARRGERACKEAEAGQENLVARQRRACRDEVAEAYTRWSARLLDLAAERLDDDARAYLEARRFDTPIKEVAQRLAVEGLDVTEQSLLNRFGGEKLVRRVRSEVHRMVLDLPRRHRQMLVRHLREEVGLTVGQVEALLCTTATSGDVPLLEEEPLLALLGWGEKKLGRRRIFRQEGVGGGSIELSARRAA